MSFLTPLFLLGALAVAVPIAIHLTNRERKDVIEFPSLMFLRRIPYRSVRRQRLRHLFLFALRCLALVLIALAFARPFFESPSAATASVLGPREVVFLVDNSYSMGYEDRLSQAKAQLLGAIGALDPEDRASIVVFSDRAEILGDPTSDREQLQALLNGIELSARPTEYGPALKVAKKILDESELSRKEVVLASDFQRLGFTGEDDDVWLPAGTDLTPIDLSSPETENLSLTSISLDRAESSGRERLTASARVTYKASAEAPARASGIRLELDGRTLQTKSVELQPNSSLTVAFDPVVVPPGAMRGSVRLDDDLLPQDNVYYFVIAPGQSLSVLNVEESSRRNRRSFYLERALAIGDRPSFRLESRTLSQLAASELAKRDVVVLNDVPTLNESQSKLLQGFVENGGGLLVILGEGSSRNAFTSIAGALLPAGLGDVVDRSEDWGGTLSYLDYQSAVFEIFGAPHSGDFSSARFFRYRSFDSAVGEGVLARFDDGSPALVERRVGAGRVLVWTSTLDTFWNDLARQPVFLPFVHQLIQHAGSYAEASSWHTVGQVMDVDRQLAMMLEEDSGPTEERTFDLVVTAPSEAKSHFPRTEERALLELGEQGFYEIRRVGGSGGSRVASLAVNLDTIESDLARLDPEELVAAVTFRDPTAEGAASQVSGESRETQEARQDYWWFLLLGAFLLLATETVLSNRLSLSAR